METFGFVCIIVKTKHCNKNAKQTCKQLKAIMLKMKTKIVKIHHKHYNRSSYANLG